MVKSTRQNLQIYKHRFHSFEVSIHTFLAFTSVKVYTSPSVSSQVFHSTITVSTCYPFVSESFK